MYKESHLAKHSKNKQHYITMPSIIYMFMSSQFQVKDISEKGYDPHC